jgi:hypothetical protein
MFYESVRVGAGEPVQAGCTNLFTVCKSCRGINGTQGINSLSEEIS